MPDIDGFLVGGASLKPEFADIVKAMVTAKGESVASSVSPFYRTKTLVRRGQGPSAKL
jgi:hypothetical protein